MYHKLTGLITVLGVFISTTAIAQTTLHVADSLFAVQDWKAAKNIYDKLITDTSHNSLEWNRLGYTNYKLGNIDEALSNYKKSAANNPPQPLKPLLFSRMAMVYSIKNDKQNAIDNIGNAITAGYANFMDMDTLKAFAAVRGDEQFKKLRNTAYLAAYPCMADTLQRAFDFWIGEWDAYVTGTQFLAGHSIIQQASGGCMVLENWTSAGTPYSGKSMNFIDAATHKWQQVWVGAEGGGQHVFTNGEYRDSAMHFDFEQTDAQGKKQKGRFTFFNQGPAQVRQLSETSGDEGKTWNTVYDFTYIRKKNS